MVKKTKSKSKPVKKSTKSSTLMEMPKMSPMPKRCTIEKAQGGFIIREGYGDKQFIAKDMKEAQKIQEKLLK